MPNVADYKKAFEAAILELCHSIGKDEVKKLDAILTQEKDDLEVLRNIITTFPKFEDIYRKNLR